MSLDRANKCEYVVTTYKGITRAVFKVFKWIKSEQEGRIEFIGEKAKESIYQRYGNKSVEAFIKTGAQSPVKYLY